MRKKELFYHPVIRLPLPFENLSSRIISGTLIVTLLAEFPAKTNIYHRTMKSEKLYLQVINY